ncbi:hypothetical protein CROQUDRAFT_657549 [Cronartium quercuum f. sp. fusiforme G11]|uniref:Uncharacterized protein n=1 Tax=Cronartium quercuum f. sp. fusiforme G11 TaxID=708437 RepID=A0A9P6TD72_9BASI|nr:hypothetical protein CROQUDRAFT_657549 [Cronartium quercuum f. sp. fusiforme G11]
MKSVLRLLFLAVVLILNAVSAHPKKETEEVSANAYTLPTYEIVPGQKIRIPTAYGWANALPSVNPSGEYLAERPKQERNKAVATTVEN